RIVLEMAVSSPGSASVLDGAAWDAAWATHAGRADVAATGGNAQAMGTKAGRVGGTAACVGGNAASNRATVPPVGDSSLGVGRRRPEFGQSPRRLGEKPSASGETLLPNRSVNFGRLRPGSRAHGGALGSSRGDSIYTCITPGTAGVLAG